MKVLVVGGGGRCHAIADALRRSPKVEKIYVAPGNAGTAEVAENVPLKDTDVQGLLAFAQKKDIEPILVTIQPGAETETDLPHMGEEFGYVLSGAVTLELGGKSYRVRKGDSFSFKPSQQHHLKNTGKTPATVIWVCTPPNF